MLSEKHLDDMMSCAAPQRFVLGDDVEDGESGERAAAILLTEEYRVGKRIKNAANLVRKITQGHETLFAVRRQLSGHRVLRPDGKGIQLALLLQGGLDEIEECFPDNALNSYLELLQKALKQFPEVAHVKPEASLVAEEFVDRVCTKLNEMVEWIRKESKGEQFQRELDSRRRQCQKNLRAAKLRAEKVFRKCSKVLVIRLDLTSGREKFERRGIIQSVSAREAKGELDRFRRYVRETYPHLGSEVKFEYGRMTGYHFHVLIYLNGHLKQAGSWLAKKMGEHWKNVITEGRGRYLNCNARWYRFPAAGMIGRGDLLKRKALERVLAYLAKTDFWVKFSGVKRTFLPSLSLDCERMRKI